MGQIEVGLVVRLCLGAKPPKVLHKVMLQRVVFSRVRDAAARGLHIFHASVWIVWSPRPGLYPSPFSLLISSRSTTLLWRTAMPTSINSRSRRTRLGAPPCAYNERERRPEPVFRSR